MFVVLISWSYSLLQQRNPVVMGPGFRRDDTGFAAPARYIRNNACRSIFPVPVFGNSSMNSHLARIFVRQQLCLDIILQFSRGVAFIERAAVHHHHRLQRHAAIRQLGGEHGAFAHVGMIGKAQLDLERIHPLAGDFHEVIGAAAEEVKAVGVAHKAVAGVDPAARRGWFPRFCRAGSSTAACWNRRAPT